MLPVHQTNTNVASKFNTTSTPALPANVTLPPNQTLPADLEVLANLNIGSRSYTPAVKFHGNKLNTFNTTMNQGVSQMTNLTAVPQ